MWIDHPFAVDVIKENCWGLLGWACLSGLPILKTSSYFCPLAYAFLLEVDVPSLASPLAMVWISPKGTLFWFYYGGLFSFLLIFLLVLGLSLWRSSRLSSCLSPIARQDSYEQRAPKSLSIFSWTSCRISSIFFLR